MSDVQLLDNPVTSDVDDSEEFAHYAEAAKVTGLSNS